MLGLNLRCFMSAFLASRDLSCAQTCGHRLQQPLPHHAEAEMLRRIRNFVFGDKFQLVIAGVLIGYCHRCYQIDPWCGYLFFMVWGLFAVIGAWND